MFFISAIRLALQWLFVASYCTGEFLICSAIACVQTLATVVQSLNSVSVILYENVVLWLQDVQEYICTIPDVINESFDYLAWLLTFFISEIDESIRSIFSLFGNLIESIGELLITIGSGCLFLISLPPLLMFYTMDTLLYASDEFYSFILNSSRSLLQEATKIRTLQAIAGIVVGIGCIILVRSLTRLRPWYSRIKTEVGRSWSKLVIRTWRGTRNCLRVTKTRKNKDQCKVQGTELCVVCFDELRSICLLPCRHLCLCEACTQALSYPLHCPLCRERADEVMHVYL